MKRHHMALAAWIFGGLVTPISFHSAIAQNGPKVPIVAMTANELRTIGIAVQSAGVEALPNSCGSIGAAGLSVSSEMLASFKSRGFSLEALCLGLTSEFRFDPDTGKPMPFAAIESRLLPLNLPNCFRRAVPFLDCSWRYDHFFGQKNTKKQDNIHPIGKQIDAISRKHIKNTGDNGVVYQSGKCDDPTNIFDIVILNRSICVMLEKVVFSDRLPLGYGYALSHPEGSDPEEEKVDLSTYGKRPGVLKPWTDDKNK